MKLCHLFKITYKGSHFFSDILNITRSLNAKLVFKYCGCPITKNIVSPSKYNMKGFKYTIMLYHAEQHMVTGRSSCSSARVSQCCLFGHLKVHHSTPPHSLTCITTAAIILQMLLSPHSLLNYLLTYFGFKPVLQTKQKLQTLKPVVYPYYYKTVPSLYSSIPSVPKECTFQQIYDDQ